MAKLVNEYLAGQYPVGNNRLGLYDRLFAQKIFDSGVITTAAGNPVSIVTNKAQNAISTLLSYSPKQTGQGDPSPQNIRPIEGWAEANLGVNSETPTKTISLGGTYYGFTVDITTGTLTVNSTFIDLGLLDWQYANNVFFSRTPPLFNNGGTAKFNGTIIADSYVEGIVSLNTPVNGRIQVANSQALPILRLSDDRFDNADDLKIALNGRMAVIELTEPITYTLTPQTVALLAGNNTLWTDGDEVSITYKAKKQGG